VQPLRQVNADRQGIDDSNRVLIKKFGSGKSPKCLDSALTSANWPKADVDLRAEFGCR